MEAMLYLATSCSLLPLVEHKRLPRTEAVLKGVAVPQRSGCPQLQSCTVT